MPMFGLMSRIEIEQTYEIARELEKQALELLAQGREGQVEVPVYLGDPGGYEAFTLYFPSVVEMYDRTLSLLRAIEKRRKELEALLN